MYEMLVLVGIALVVLGFILVFAFVALNATPVKQPQNGSANSSVQGGGVILIGPIPIVFGTSSTMTVIAGIVGLVLFVLSVIFYFFLVPH
jgi:uncharacterized protein (TIGR00304 family)